MEKEVSYVITNEKGGFLTQSMTIGVRPSSSSKWKKKEAADRFLSMWLKSKKKTRDAEEYHVLPEDYKTARRKAPVSTERGQEPIDQVGPERPAVTEKSAPEMPVLNYVKVPMEFGAVKHSKVDQAMDLLERMNTCFKEYDNLMKQCGQDQEESEKTLMDLRHLIELSPDCDVSHGYDLYCRERNQWQTRRDCKDASALLTLASEVGWNNPFYDAVLQKLNELKRRHYKTRSQQYADQVWF